MGMENIAGDGLKVPCVVFFLACTGAPDSPIAHFAECCRAEENFTGSASDTWVPTCWPCIAQHLGSGSTKASDLANESVWHPGR
jgi:hypothetical protein